MNLKPYRFTGADGTHLGRHGVLKKNAVVWLDQSEQSYLSVNPNPQLKPISEAEAKKANLTPPKLTGDGAPEGATDGAPENTEVVGLAYEIAEMEKSLVADFNKKELLAMAKEHNVEHETDANKEALAKLLAPVVVAKNREEAKE